MKIGNWEIKTYGNNEWEVYCSGRLIHSNKRSVPTIDLPKNIIKEMKKMGIN